MKASEVLRRYAAGERDFRRVNLRGQSFKGANLAGADFSEADIRGANFVDAILIETNLSGVRAGQQNLSLVKLQILSLTVSALSGFISVFAGYWTVLLYSNANILIPTAIVFSFFCLIAAIRGIGSVSVAAALIGILSLAIFLSVDLLIMVSFPGWEIPLKEIAVAGAVTGAAVVAIAVAILMALVIATATVTAINAKIRIRRGLILVTIVVLTAAVAAKGFLTAQVIPETTIETAIVGAGTGFYLAWQALSGDDKQAIIRNTAIAIAVSIGGTSFRGSDLTDADFSKATVEATDFRNSINQLTKITRTRWYHAQKIEIIRPGTTYLRNSQIRQLVMTGEGQNENFARLDLRGVNLQKANLENASFIDADFYQANLQKANLSRAILVRTNFERADLRGANLTGSCIQDWTISRDTKLDGIICEYVYLKWVNGDKIDQMPPRGKFQEGGFVTFVKYILETVELYHEKDINPRLALTVLQKMSRDYDEPLDIVALGKKGEGIFIQVKVSENIQREDFKDDYRSRYDNNLKLWSGNIHQLPPTVNSFIEKRISEIASQKTDEFIFVDAAYVEGNYTQTYQGEVNMSGDRNIHMGSGNYNERIDGNYVQGNYYTAGQKQTLAEAAAEIQKLLEQLEKSYATDTMTGKMTVATEVIKRIENNPPLMNRVLSALKAGGVQALAQALNHPAASFVIGALEDWQKAKGN